MTHRHFTEGSPTQEDRIRLCWEPIRRATASWHLKLPPFTTTAGGMAAVDDTSVPTYCCQWNEGKVQKMITSHGLAACRECAIPYRTALPRRHAGIQCRLGREKIPGRSP